MEYLEYGKIPLYIDLVMLVQVNGLFILTQHNITNTTQHNTTQHNTTQYNTQQQQGIRLLLKQRLESMPLQGQKGVGHEALLGYKRDFVKNLIESPIAIETDRANEQHYEVPTEYYDLALGPRKKYSSCVFPTFTETLSQAENLAFEQVCERAQMNDPDKEVKEVVDLGCGWGSLTLYLLEHYPNINVTSISNS